MPMLHIRRALSWLNRAVRDELFPTDGPARDQIHKTFAAIILRVFDKEYPESDVRDDTVVNLRVKRHGFVKESSFVAGDLRTENKNALIIMAQRFLNDPVVMGGELEPAPAGPPAFEGSSLDDFGADAARNEQEAETEPEPEPEPEAPPITTASLTPAEWSNTAFVGTKLGCLKGVGRRDEEGAKPPLLPEGIYVHSEVLTGGTTLRLKVKLGPMTVNGEEVVSAKKMKVVSGIAMNAGNIVALRYVRVLRIGGHFCCTRK